MFPAGTGEEHPAHSDNLAAGFSEQYDLTER